MAGAERAANAFDLIGHRAMGGNLIDAATKANNTELLAKIQAAADAGDRAALLKILSQNTNLTAAPRARAPDMPYDMRPAKPSTDAVERRLVEQDLGPVGETMPQPAVRSALDEIIAADGGDNLIARLAGMTPRPEYSLDIFNNPSILSQANTDFPPPTAAAMDVNVGAGVPSSPSTAIIPASPSGLSAGGGGGVIVPPGRGLTTTGGPRAMSVQGMESPAPRRLPAPNQRRIEGPTPRGRDLPQPRRQAIEDPEVPPRNPRGESPAPRRRQVDPRLVAAGIGAGAAGLHMVNEYLTEGRPAGGSAVADSGPTTADLAAESAPPPRVPVASGELTPREQAHELIAKLNLMRRNAGGEVPEAAAMQREINRLLAMSNQTMAAASRGEVAMAGNDPHAQATRLLAQLNQMRREAGGEVPQARQVMAEVARLNRLGDAQRNARTTAFPRRAG